MRRRTIEPIELTDERAREIVAALPAREYGWWSAIDIMTRRGRVKRGELAALERAGVIESRRQWGVSTVYWRRL